MVGLDQHAAGVVADEVAQASAQLQRGAAVEAQHQDGPRRYARDAQQPRAAVHDDPRLARARPGEHQHRLVLVRFDDAALVLAQARDDALPRGRPGRARELAAARAEAGVEEALGRQPEVVVEQPQAGGRVLRHALRELVHDVDLRRALVLVLGERPEVLTRELAARRALRHAQRHRLPEDGEALVQHDRADAVQEQQRVLDLGGGIGRWLAAQIEVLVDRLDQLLERELDQHGGAAAVFARQAREHGVEADLGDGMAAAARRHCDLPRTVQAREALVAGRELHAQPRRAVRGVQGAIGHRRDDRLHGVHRRVVAAGGQRVRHRLQAHGARLAVVEVGRLFAQQLDERRLQPRCRLQPRRRRFGDAVAHERGHQRAARQQPRLLHLEQHAQHGAAAGGAGLRADDADQRRHAEEVVGRQAFVGVGVGQAREHREPCRRLGRGQAESGDPRLGLAQVGHQRAALEHRGGVAVAAQEAAALQPRDRRQHARRRAAIGRRQALGELVVLQDLAGRADRFAFVAVAHGPRQAADAPQDPLHVLRAQPRGRGEAELRLDVVVGRQQHRRRRLAVAPGAADLLHVGLQRAGDLEVHDQPDVGLVDAHAERVGGADDAAFAGEEPLLHRLLLRHVEAGVERLGLDAGDLQQLGGLLGVAARRRVDEHAAARAGGELVGHQFAQAGHLVVGRHRLDAQRQVGARRVAVEDLQVLAEFVAEVPQDLVAHLRLGGRGHAGDRRWRRGVAGAELAHEARGVQVVGPEVVAPLGQAVGLVEDPAADLAQRDRLGEGRVAQLLGRDVQQAGLPGAHRVERRAPLRRRQPARQRVREVRAGLGAEVVDLIVHQRLQRRHDHGQRAAPQVALDGGQLETQRLAAAGRQQRQQRLVGEAGVDDGALRRPTVGQRRLRAEVVVLEPPPQLRQRIVHAAAPAAAGVAARHVAQRPQQFARLWQLAADPRHHDRRRGGVRGGGHAQPRDREQQRQRGGGFAAGSGGRRRQRVGARAVGEQRAQIGREVAGGVAGGFVGVVAGVLAGVFVVCRAEVVGEQRHAGGGGGVDRRHAEGAERAHDAPEGRRGAAEVAQSLPRIRQQPQREARVGRRVVAGVAHELVVLDQRVVRMLRERDRRQRQRVERRLAQQPQVGRVLRQPRQVVPMHVVADDDVRRRREVVERAQGRGRITVHRAPELRVAEPGADREQAALAVEFEVDPDGCSGSGHGGAESTNDACALAARAWVRGGGWRAGAVQRCNVVTFFDATPPAACRRGRRMRWRRRVRSAGSPRAQQRAMPSAPTPAAGWRIRAHVPFCSSR